MTIAFILPLTFSTIEKSNRENFNHGISTMGTIVSAHKDMLPIAGNKDNLRKIQEVAKVEYTVQGNLYTVSATRQLQHELWSQGDKAEVYYKIGDPKHSTIHAPGIAGTENRMLQQVTYFIGGVILLGFSTWRFLRSYAPSHKR